MEQQYFFVHGWGNGPEFWEKMGVYFLGSQLHFIDLGFIKGRSAPRPDSGRARAEKSIYITHSLGTLWALKNRHREMSALVVINGFYNFKPFCDEKTLLSMKQRLEKDPIPQMGAFWRRCGIRPENVLLNPERLQEGMGWLTHQNAAKELRGSDIPVLSLAAKNDPVLNIEGMRQHWSGYPLIIHETGGHSLPWSEPRWCAKQIRNFIDALNLEK